MSAQIIFVLGMLSGLAVGALLWLGSSALADRAPDGEAEVSKGAIAAAINAVAPAVDRWNAEHADGRLPTFLPLSLRLAIGRDVAAALVNPKPEASR